MKAIGVRNNLNSVYSQKFNQANTYESHPINFGIKKLPKTGKTHPVLFLKDNRWVAVPMTKEQFFKAFKGPFK